MENKESKLLNFVIFLIAVSLFAMGAFMYLKGNNNDKDKKNDKETKEEIEIKEEDKLKEFNYDDAKKLVDSFFKVKNPFIFSDIIDNGLNDYLKLKIALLNTDNFSIDYKCSDLFEVGGIYNAYFRGTPNESNSWGCMDSESVKSYLYDDINNKYKALFGKDLEAIKEGFDSVPSFDYSKNVDAYVILNARYNPIYEELYIYDVISFEQSEENLDIIISFVKYDNHYENKEKVYYAYLNDLVDPVTYQNEDEIKKYYDENKDDAYKLTLKFILEDNHYILKDVVK